MPRYSNDTMLKRAITDAISDRESFLECHAPRDPNVAHIKETIEDLESLRGIKFKDMTPEETEIARLAFVYADQWLAGVWDAQKGSTWGPRSFREYRLMHSRRLELFGKTAFEVMEENTPTVSIYELSAKSELLLNLLKGSDTFVPRLPE